MDAIGVIFNIGNMQLKVNAILSHDKLSATISDKEANFIMGLYYRFYGITNSKHVNNYIKILDSSYQAHGDIFSREFLKWMK